jgi:hypothetical protein
MNCSKWLATFVTAVGVYMTAISIGAGVNQAFASCVSCGGTPVCALLDPSVTPCATGACATGPLNFFCAYDCFCDDQRTETSCVCQT